MHGEFREIDHALPIAAKPREIFRLHQAPVIAPARPIRDFGGEGFQFGQKALHLPDPRFIEGDEVGGLLGGSIHLACHNLDITQPIVLLRGLFPAEQ